MSGPIVTLLTDFGERDSYVGEMKGVLLTACRNITLVDVSHDIAPGDITGANYVLRRTWRRFPEGTVHLCVVDPGVGTTRRALGGEKSGHYLVGPDNGVFTGILDESAWEIEGEDESVSATFHGRDIFAPAAARLACGTRPDELGFLVHDLARVEDSGGAGSPRKIVYVDRFGNLVTDIPATEAVKQKRILIGGREIPFGTTFSDVAPGELVAYVGSGGCIEVAVRGESAAEALRVGRGVEVELAD